MAMCLFVYPVNFNFQDNDVIKDLRRRNGSGRLHASILFCMYTDALLFLSCRSKAHDRVGVLVVTTANSNSTREN